MVIPRFWPAPSPASSVCYIASAGAAGRTPGSRLRTRKLALSRHTEGNAHARAAASDRILILQGPRVAACPAWKGDTVICPSVGLQWMRLTASSRVRGKEGTAWGADDLMLLPHMGFERPALEKDFSSYHARRNAALETQARTKTHTHTQAAVMCLFSRASQNRRRGAGECPRGCREVETRARQRAAGRCTAERQVVAAGPQARLSRLAFFATIAC